MHPVYVCVTCCSDGHNSKAIFPQVAEQVLQLFAAEIRCPSRAWKVYLLGEGADDAGGVFDEIVSQMCGVSMSVVFELSCSQLCTVCAYSTEGVSSVVLYVVQELESGVVNLLIPSPNATNKCGFNMDRFVFNPEVTLAKDYKHLKFLGVLLGVAMRTKKPIDLHLARPMWKLLAGMNLTPDDLEEVCIVWCVCVGGWVYCLIVHVLVAIHSWVCLVLGSHTASLQFGLCAL